MKFGAWEFGPTPTETELIMGPLSHTPTCWMKPEAKPSGQGAAARFGCRGCSPGSGAKAQAVILLGRRSSCEWPYVICTEGLELGLSLVGGGDPIWGATAPALAFTLLQWGAVCLLPKVCSLGDVTLLYLEMLACLVSRLSFWQRQVANH